jgi:glycosyltransferase involved in cell wall biosynthesis
MLAVIETHPIQYHAPVYRALQAKFNVPVTAIYGSDFSARRYRDREFATDVAWDVDLLGGYSHVFLSRVGAGHQPDVNAISAEGLHTAIAAVAPAATMVVGYSPAFHRHAWYAAWRYGAPVLFRGEASDEAQTRNRIKRLARDAALGVAYRSCARVLYIGTRARRHYRAHGVTDDRLVFAPYCVDTTPFQCDETARGQLRPATRAEWGMRPDDVVVLFSGKLSARKGVDLLVPALRQLPSALRQRIALVCAGDGDLRSALAAEAAGEPAVRLLIAGHQTQQALSRCYHAADLLVLPSLHAETWGLVVNEALHHGVPCVVSNRVGCAPDLIDGVTGIVCEADSAAALAHAIVKTHARSADPAVRQACRDKVAAYSVDHAAAGIADAYAAVTGKRVAA